MDQKLFTELRSLYCSTRERPNVIRLRIRIRDLIDPDILRSAVVITMKRYPYFCVELKKKDGQLVFVENPRPVVITHSLHGVELNAEASNFHMIAFSWECNWIIMDISHSLTDGTGAYEIIRTLLYYYCSETYDIRLKDGGIRLYGDVISQEEWEDPVEKTGELPAAPRVELPPALKLIDAAGLRDDTQKTVYSVTIPESEFMKFTVDNDGSPGTMVSLFLSRAIAKVCPESKDVIRIALCLNQRNALHAPLAHQSLVGGVMLEYKEQMRRWPLERQATAYRGMVFAQSQTERVLEGVASQKGINQMILTKETDQERIGVAGYINQLAGMYVTATVSYVGKANCQEAERYIRDFRGLTSPSSDTILVEISAVNGRFTLDFIQAFSNPVFVNAFLKELDENGITYDLQDVTPLELPNIRLPWSK